MGAQDEAPRFDDRLKAAMAAAANLIFMVAVMAIWAVESPLLGAHQIYGRAPLLFVIAVLLIVLYFGALATSDRYGRLIDMLARAAASGIVEGEGRSGSDRAISSRRRALLANLWTPVTLNFLVAGGLIYASGGILNSPYGQVPIAMMLIGQSVYGVPPIDLRGRSSLPRPVVFVFALVRLYAYPLVLIVSLELALVALQHFYPLVRTPAPAPEFVLTTLLSLLASMCVTFVTRRADQASGGLRDHDDPCSHRTTEPAPHRTTEPALKAQATAASAASLVPRNGANTR